ncbi:hydantoinase B/oxoprolinase family protein [Telluribacter sp. SYSU D00476]|uniref:hydantoinase B/oxoprolinase family protein n=1 Tax=Telluribacter sp. SYSU D00476 TaxID=2811430 RepID=UPI001FF2EAD7|nr:hydantoinase B/oxoprolinase family protein [Telluribacter sp. SYSU D00476]
MTTATTPWKIWIDTGGTFTDCLAIDPSGQRHRAKVLSSGYLRGRIIRKVDANYYEFEAPWQHPSHLLNGYHFRLQGSHSMTKLLSINYESKTITLEDNLTPIYNVDFELFTGEEAPVLATRLVTGTPLRKPFPPLSMRLGTTKGTNALLEKKGAKTLLVVTQGFEDLLRIGTQQRPHLFQLNIPEPTLLYQAVFGIRERLEPDGSIDVPLTQDELARLGSYCTTHGFESVAISLLHSYRNPIHEEQIASYLKSIGIPYLSQSARLFPGLHYLRRTQTAVINAYLSPVLDTYLRRIRTSLGDASLKVMTSAGGLVGANNFRAKDSLLSGPAGGMVAATSLAQRLGFDKVLTFDMGGTSTDTARIAGRPDIQYTTRINSLEMHSPALAIETVAAGGGSVCWYDGFSLRVGPESAGAHPGPACYGAGGPLTITDVNLLLGKMDPTQLGIPIHRELAEEALTKLQDEITNSSGSSLTGKEILLGLERIANEKMAEAIRRISVAKGVDPRDYALLTFGGAGGLHGCQLAEILGVQHVIIPFDAGLFSALGMGEAQVSRIVSVQVLQKWTEIASQLPDLIQELQAKGIQEVQQEAVGETEVGFCSVFLRYSGQESSIEVPYQGADTLRQFEQLYQTQFGYLPHNRDVEVESLRMMIQEKKEETSAVSSPEHFQKLQPRLTLKSPYMTEQEVGVYDWQTLGAGDVLTGPAILRNATSTTYLPEGWEAITQATGDIIVSDKRTGASTTAIHHTREVELELFTNRFTAIAEEMGAQLQRSAFSVNVKERLDFSCALLDPKGELLVNAPHIPVHLGSLGICTRLVKEVLEIGPGDVVITNHPRYGGSHLPDVTLIAGVFTEYQQCVGYVVNRAHHAEIGGKRPGSMPPDATRLHEEGVAILPQYLVRQGEMQWEAIKKLFTESPYPTRMLAENEADIVAALSSLRRGQEELLNLVHEHGVRKVITYMQLLKRSASQQVRQALKPLIGKQLKAVEYIDDGRRIALQVSVDNRRIRFDFTGTSKVHSQNLNANISIIHSAILYVLRLLVGKEIPLNDGLMNHVDLVLPEDSFLHPHFEDDPTLCPAVVGGNTEVSQRLVDTLLKAFGLAACSQGTMNNFLFGNDRFGYYETIGGGAGAGPGFGGRSGVHQHMTNTRITDPEELERRYPVRLRRFGIRTGSGGAGKWKGGDGIIREFEFKENLDVTLIGQHNHFSPYGLEGGEAGKTSIITFVHKDGVLEKSPAICSKQVHPGERLIIETPGGGGYGQA